MLRFVNVEHGANAEAPIDTAAFGDDVVVVAIIIVVATKMDHVNG